MKTILMYLVMAAGMLLGSCEKFAEVPSPPNAVLAEQVFANDVKAEAAVNGIYSYMMSSSPSFSSWLVSIYAGCSSDELLRFNAKVTDEEFVTNELSASNTLVGRIWTSAYKAIYQANSGLEGLTASKTLSPAVQNRLLGECYFLRAFSYWYLTQLYGDVPRVLTTDWELNSTMPRTAKAEVLQEIEKDLTMARQLLPETYPSNARGRVNKWAAEALLARLYVFGQQWDKAIASSTAVLNSGLYTPLTELNKVFLAGSKEAIWQLVPDEVNQRYVPELLDGGYYTTSIPKFYLRPAELQAYETGDQRRLVWTDSVTYQGTRYYWPGKYKDITRKNNEYYVVLRAAEQYLLRAEAKCMSQQVTEAISDLNVIRKRAGLANYSGAVTQNAVMDAIVRERRIELMAEWGHRWFDLKRLGKADEVLGAIKVSTWQSNDVLWPVPEQELINNIELSQNPGY